MQDLDQNGELYVREVPTRTARSGASDVLVAWRRLEGCAEAWTGVRLAAERSFPASATLSETLHRFESRCTSRMAGFVGFTKCKPTMRERGARRSRLASARSRLGVLNFRNCGRASALLREGMAVDEYRQANRGMTVQPAFAAFLARVHFGLGGTVDLNLQEILVTYLGSEEGLTCQPARLY